MARNQNAAEALTGTAQDAVLHPGRSADPAPASQKVVSANAGNGAIGTAETDSNQADAESIDSVEATGDAGPVKAESRQRTLRLMLRQCDRVLLIDFDLLAMNDWPDNFSVAAARRSRDLWMFSAIVAAIIFLSGLTGFVPAWIAGGGFGAFIIILLLGIPAVRRIYTSAPSYLDLLIKRQRMMRDARKHAEHLEGKEGLIWQCARMADFNPALKNARFSSLLHLSEQKSLPRALSRREHVRLYLIYLLEAENAYGRVQAAFFEGNQEAIDKGWQKAAAEPEDRT
jgi:hypothetical protein